MHAAGIQFHHAIFVGQAAQPHAVIFRIIFRAGNRGDGSFQRVRACLQLLIAGFKVIPSRRDAIRRRNHDVFGRSKCGAPSGSVARLCSETRRRVADCPAANVAEVTASPDKKSLRFMEPSLFVISETQKDTRFPGLRGVAIFLDREGVAISETSSEARGQYSDKSLVGKLIVPCCEMDSSLRSEFQKSLDRGN